MTVGFVGLGVMGLPIARNLASRRPLIVWNRTEAKAQAVGHGARVASDVDELFALADVVVMMLADEAAIDSVLARGTAAFARRVQNRTIVHMGTTSPEYSLALSQAVAVDGGTYVEAPVSGSREPAERGELVAMLAGEPGSVEVVREIVRPATKAIFDCGAVPNAARMKLAVNTFLIALVTGLAEAVHFAARQGLDLDTLRAILEQGPMSSSVSRSKLHKMTERDFSVQAAISDVFKNASLITAAARQANAASPLLDACFQLFEEANGMGLGDADFSAVIRALERRSGGSNRE